MSNLLTDHSWMYKRKNPHGRGINPTYIEGVSAFLQFARVNLGGAPYIRCPCKNCTLNILDTHENVELHLLRWGFMGGYLSWDHHKEFHQQSSNKIENQEAVPFSTIVMDVAGPSFDWTTENIIREELPNPKVARFYKLLSDAEQPLYPSCRQSRLEVVARFLTIKSDGGMTDATFNRMMKQVKSLLPEHETLTENYYQTKKLVKKLGLSYVKVHACQNDCILYYQEYADFHSCQNCGQSRYKPGKEPISRRKGVPNKQLRYFPITPRLQRLYLSTKTAMHMTWHKRISPNDGDIIHPSDGDSWKHFDIVYPQFSEESYNVKLGIATNGFDPFSLASAPYSCWPVFLTPYNLPLWMCMKQQYFYLTMIIPGHPGKNIDVYLRPHADELNNLWENDVITYDASKRQNFTMKAALMWTIGDFPTYRMLSGWSTHGPRSCPHCMGSSKAFMLPHGRKPCYFDCHRRFLNCDHPCRRNRDSFRRGKIEKDPPPPILTGEELYEIVSCLPDITFGPTVNA